METIENIQEELKEILSKERYKHSIGVMKKAEELAKQYGIDPNVAALTGLAHDIGKEMSNQEKIQYCQKNEIEIEELADKMELSVMDLKDKLEGKEEFYIDEMMKIKTIFQLNSSDCDEIFFQEEVETDKN